MKNSSQCEHHRWAGIFGGGREKEKKKFKLD